LGELLIDSGPPPCQRTDVDIAPPSLRILSEAFPTLEAAASEVAALHATLGLPKGVIHVISDVHGEHRKLRHVINNGSGRLRPLVDALFAGRIDDAEKQELINILYYPAEKTRLKHREFQAEPSGRAAWIRRTLGHQFDIIRALIRVRRRKDVKNLTPKQYRELFEALLNEPAGGHDPAYIDAQLAALSVHDLDFAAIRSASRFIRTLGVSELIVAGDLGDRGPRIDKVVDYLMRQPNVSLVWGNHDVSWMGACLGQPALIATVLRISLRYRRMYQLEEGYGLATKALERLAETVYADDPADRFPARRAGERDARVLARMQKAIAIMQCKLEGQTIARHPEWQMDDRDLLKFLSADKTSIVIGGQVHQLLDTHLPTIDPADPNRLSPEEQECLDRLIASFTTSPRLWEHMQWMAERGRMAMTRDKAVIFHACLPVDEAGRYQPVSIDGVETRGPKMFGAFTRVIKRAFRAGPEVAENDRDWLYYLWAGPRSPLFGKDKMTTFETYFLGDHATHVETKNPWFRWIHNHAFCDRVAREMGVPEDGLIVNGHVPVKVEKGESPLKDGGNAVTIDGAFSEAYGDRGYTLILSPESDILAEHHSFPDPETAIRENIDIIPSMHELRRHSPPRVVNDTEKGRAIREMISALEALMDAYTQGLLLERNDR
jgi:fructose-1,6-bisphosphatase-3